MGKSPKKALVGKWGRKDRLREMAEGRAETAAGVRELLVTSAKQMERREASDRNARICRASSRIKSLGAWWEQWRRWRESAPLKRLKMYARRTQ
eukprot:2405879-Pleurochrysis_carterae.AAC.1